MTAPYQQSLSEYYCRTYFEWRRAYHLNDSCMHELVSAMRVELENHRLEREDALRLRKLILMVQAELDFAAVIASERAA